MLRIEEAEWGRTGPCSTLVYLTARSRSGGHCTSTSPVDSIWLPLRRTRGESRLEFVFQNSWLVTRELNFNSVKITDFIIMIWTTKLQQSGRIFSILNSLHCSRLTPYLYMCLSDFVKLIIQRKKRRLAILSWICLVRKARKNQWIREVGGRMMTSGFLPGHLVIWSKTRRLSHSCATIE